VPGQGPGSRLTSCDLSWPQGRYSMPTTGSLMTQSAKKLWCLYTYEWAGPGIRHSRNASNNNILDWSIHCGTSYWANAQPTDKTGWHFIIYFVKIQVLEDFVYHDKTKWKVFIVKFFYSNIW